MLPHLGADLLPVPLHLAALRLRLTIYISTQTPLLLELFMELRHCLPVYLKGGVELGAGVR